MAKKAAPPVSYNETRISQTYVKKENKFTMTDVGKYSMTDASAHSGTSKEWTLSRNLEDAEMLIQEQSHKIAELK